MEEEASAKECFDFGGRLFPEASPWPRTVATLVGHGLLAAVVALPARFGAADLATVDEDAMLAFPVAVHDALNTMLQEAEALSQEWQEGAVRQPAAQAAAALRGRRPEPAEDVQAAMQQLGQLRDCLPHAEEAARLLQQAWQAAGPEQLAAARRAAAQAAATRCCAYLRCPNLGAPGGPDAGQQPGGKLCGGC